MTIGPKRYESRPVVSKLPHKRKLQDANGDSSMGRKSKLGEPVSKLLVCGYPSDHPFNKVHVYTMHKSYSAESTGDMWCRVAAVEPVLC